MFVQYAACFGVELTVNNVAATYFSKEFDLSTTRAGMVASLFGLMNLFARSLGGFWSGEHSGTFTPTLADVARLFFSRLVTLPESSQNEILPSTRAGTKQTFSVLVFHIVTV